MYRGYTASKHALAGLGALALEVQLLRGGEAAPPTPRGGHIALGMALGILLVQGAHHKAVPLLGPFGALAHAAVPLDLLPRLHAPRGSSALTGVGISIYFSGRRQRGRCGALRLAGTSRSTASV